MCAFNAALNFGKDMIGLSVSTLGTLVAVQLADVTNFLKRQSDTVSRAGAVRDVAAFVALEREYREAFWADRRKTLAATTGALQVASRHAAKSWAAWVGERNSSAAPIEKEPARETLTPVAIEQAEAPATGAAVPTKARSAVADSKIRTRRRSKTAKDASAPTKAGVEATRSKVRKRARSPSS